MKVVVNIKLKDGVLDPAAKATEHALHALGFNCVSTVCFNKQIILDIDTKDIQFAKEQAKQMCEDILANTVIEEYEIIA